MEPQRIILLLCVGYLLGSINTAIVVSKLTLGKDIRTLGSGNAGLTNSWRCMGKWRTAVVLAGDIGKTILSCLIGEWLLPEAQIGVLVAGIACVMGHMFPLYFKFKGGKGVLCGATMGAMFDWRIFLCLAIIFVVVVAVTKYVSLGSILIGLLFPLASLVVYRDIGTFLLTGCVGWPVVYMHRSNIGRLLRHEENKFSLHTKK